MKEYAVIYRYTIEETFKIQAETKAAAIEQAKTAEPIHQMVTRRKWSATRLWLSGLGSFGKGEM